MSVPVHGLLRALLAATGAAALVYASTSVSAGLDLAPAVGSGTGQPGSVDEAAQDVVLSCPGPELSGVAGVADVPVTGTVTAAAAPTEAIPGLVLPTGAGTLSVGTGADGSAAAASPGRGQVVQAALPAGAAPVEVRGTGSLGAAVAGAQEWSADTKELRGLTTTPCTAATADAWLLGGGGSPGRQERLVLVNPGANEVVVGISLHGRTGALPSPTGTGITVPANGRAVVLLDALAGTEAMPAVHVEASGGTVAAFLDDDWLDGSIPAGVDTVPSVAPPATTQVIPAAALDGPGIVRVAVPGTKEAVVRVRLIGPNGGLPLPGADTGVARVAGGAVAELSLASVPVGTYAVEVTADVPVVAAAFVQRRAGTEPGDFAWSTATPALTGTAGTTFPTATGGGPQRSLTLVATDGSVTADVVTMAGGTASTQRVTLAGDTSTTLPLGSTGSVWVTRAEGDGQLRGAVTSTVGTGATQLIASIPLLDTVLTSRVIRAFPLP
jgi:hypothetical protein